MRFQVLTSAEHIKIDPDEWKWIMKRQEQYDKRVSGDFLDDRASQGAFDLHKRIVAEIDQLTYEEGGRKCGV